MFFIRTAYLLTARPDANADMIARDQKREAAAAAWREHQKAKAEYIAAEDAKRNAPKLALSGLQRVYSSTHLLGSYR